VPDINIDAHQTIQALIDKHEENADQIAALAKKLDTWGSLLSTPSGKIVGAMLVSMATLFITWVSGKMDPTPHPAPAPVINIVGGDTVSPIQPPVKSLAGLTLYCTASTVSVASDQSIKGLPVTADQKPYADGSTYPFGGKNIPVPCMAWKDATGTVVDVQPFSNAGDVAAYLKGKAGK
jgi:hypothetical protein